MHAKRAGKRSAAPNMPQARPVRYDVPGPKPLCSAGHVMRKRDHGACWLCIRIEEARERVAIDDLPLFAGADAHTLTIIETSTGRRFTYKCPPQRKRLAHGRSRKPARR